MSILRYAVSGPVILVTPDGRLATTSTSVINTADGTVLGPLTTTGAVQAVSADRRTRYISTGSTIATVNLDDY